MKYTYLVAIFFFFTVSCSTKSQDKAATSPLSLLLIEEEEVVVRPYGELKAEALERRDEFKKRYNASNKNKVKQDSILNEAQEYLLTISDEFFKAWYGTPWTFEGHTEVPREGSIACGYFITTTLRDMGFNSPRIKWAQQTSGYLIKKVTTDIKRFHQVPMKDIVDHITEKGEGLYIVGLDSHVGYIYYRNGKMTFVHSNYYRRDIGVMSEPLIGRNPLNDSKGKMIGKIFDKEMVRNWVLGVKYEA